MHPYHNVCLEGALKWLERTREGSKRDGIRVGVLGGTGHGDKARQLAFCAAVRAKYLDAHIFFLAMPFAEGSAMVDYDMAWCAKTCGIVDGYYFMAGVDRELVVSDIRSHFDVLYDAIPYAVKAYWRNAHIRPDIGARKTPGDCITAMEMQVEADMALAPFRWLYDGHPELDWRLRHRNLNVWEIMAESSDLEVTPLDLALATPLDLAPWPTEEELTTPLSTTGEVDPAATLAYIQERAGSDDEGKLDLGYVGDYVMVHNAAGRGGQTKVAPPTVFKSIISFLESEGIRAVQVGRKGERKLADSVIDRRGLRLPLTNRIMRRGECLGLIGIDSLPMYMAMGLGTAQSPGKPAMILWGSTMRNAFGLPIHLNLVRLMEVPGGLQQACRLSAGCCFRLPGYGATCMLPKEANEHPDECLNILPPEDAGRAAVEFATTQRAVRDGTLVEEAVA